MPEDLSHKLILETGKLTWPELQRYFARGVIIIVSKGEDLVKVATAISRDDKNEIKGLIDSGQIVRATDEHAKNWQSTDPLFWAVVVAPWVVVQEITE